LQSARLRHGGSSRSALGWELQATTPPCGCYSAKHILANLRCAALGMHNLPVADEAHLLFWCPATAGVKRERAAFAQLHKKIVAGSHVIVITNQDSTSSWLLPGMCCGNVYRVALFDIVIVITNLDFVHKCTKIADAAAVAAARQQPR
jgi:hypothetical protein